MPAPKFPILDGPGAALEPRAELGRVLVEGVPDRLDLLLAGNRHLFAHSAQYTA